MEKEKKRFLSWGLGVQSTYLLVLAANRQIAVDAVIVADTQWERAATMEMFDFYRRYAESRGLPVLVGTAGDVRQLGALDHQHMPFFPGHGGPLSRQCTRHFKLDVIKRVARSFAGYDVSLPPHPKPGEFEMILGISSDEWERMAVSRDKFLVNCYPLVERRMSRNEIVREYAALGLPVPPKSACIACPYRRASEYMELLPQEFQAAVDFDREIRYKRFSGCRADTLYVWRGKVDLGGVDLELAARKEREGKQLPLFCTGPVCWV